MNYIEAATILYLPIKSNSKDVKLLKKAFKVHEQRSAASLCMEDFLSDYERIELLCSEMGQDELDSVLEAADWYISKLSKEEHPMARWAMQARNEWQATGDRHNATRALCRAYDALGEESGRKLIEEMA